jgi:phosphodiesterase/alkaline phosphatase D-like protein
MIALAAGRFLVDCREFAAFAAREIIPGAVSMIRRLCLVPLLLLAAGCGPGPDTGSSPGGLEITTGPILGRLGTDHVGVWARTTQPGQFRVFYGTSPDALTSSAGPATTLLENDNTGWTLIEGLAPATKYYYEIGTGDGPSGIERLAGNFHTLPDSAAFVDSEANPEGLFNYRFEFACGNNQNTGSGSSYSADLPTFRTMRRELVRNDEPSKIDFAILNGDWLYEEERLYTRQQWADQVGIPVDQAPRIVNVMPNIAGLWENYKLYLRRGVNLANWHRYVPTYFTFDDHEILNDVYGAGEVGRVDRRAVFRDVGVSAWYDYLGWSNEVPETQDILFGRARLTGGGDTLVDPQANFSNLNLEQAATLHVHWGTPDWGEML